MDRLQNANVSEMVNAMNTAITGGADGIAVALVDNKAFNSPTDAALKAKIPVVSYNADAVGNTRLAYIGQDLFPSGQEMGKRIVELVAVRDVAIFIATPGSANIQPRIDGALCVLKSHPSITTSPSPQARRCRPSCRPSTPTSGPSGHEGLFAVDAGSTQSVAQTMQKHYLRSKGVKAGGYDLTPITQKPARPGPARLHHRPAAVPAGLPARPGAVPVRGVQDADRDGRRQHRAEVPRQEHRGAL